MGTTFSMASTFFVLTCVLMCIIAAPVCKKRVGIDEVGLCSPNGTATTWHCPSCPPGHGLSVECGRMYPEGTIVGCVPCKRGYTYSFMYDISQCKKCTRCQKNEVIKSGKCEPDKPDTIQCNCKEKYYKDTWKDCKPCSWCCGDKTNEFVDECRNLETKCSFQTAKSCAPTTPAPTTAITSLPNTTQSTSSTTAPTTKSKNTSNSFTNDSNDSESTPKDPQETEKEPGGGRKSEGISVQAIIMIVIIIIAVLFIISGILCLVISCYWRRRGLLGLVSRDGEREGFPREVTGKSIIFNVKTISAKYIKKGETAQPLLSGPHTEVSSNGSGAHVVLDSPHTAIGAYHVEPEATQWNSESGPPPEQPPSGIGEENENPNSQQHPPRSGGGGNDNPDPQQPSPGRNGEERDSPQLDQRPHTSAQGSQGNSGLSRECERQSGVASNGEDEISAEIMKRELIHKTYGPCVNSHEVRHKVGLMLNYIRKLKGNDYRMVAEKIGMDYHEIQNLARAGSPMEEVFDVMSSRVIEVDKFVDILIEIDRGDVVQKMYEMALESSRSSGSGGH